jgi:type IV pilus modification protein PilV
MSHDRRRPHARRRPDEAGFTLIEALVAILLLVVGLVAIANLNVVAVRNNVRAKHMTAASDIAADQLERLKNLRFDDLALNAGGNVDVTDTANPYRREVALPPAAATSNTVTTAEVGSILVAWRIELIGTNTKFITVRAESRAMKAASRAEFTTIRTCTTSDCP